jgi:Na+/phosphate symporter
MKEVAFQALGGLGLFLFGMKIMSEGLQKVAGRKMHQILQMVSNNRFVGFGVGAAVTSIIQGSSATTITAQLASLGTNTNARCAANAHTLFNVVGVVIIVAIFPVFLDLVEIFTQAVSHLGPPDLMLGGQKDNISRYIANSHTLFNLVVPTIFLLLLTYLVNTAFQVG